MKRYRIWMLLPLVAATLVVATLFGSVRIPFSALFDRSNPILWSIRFPRVLTAALVGAALSVSGAAMQGLLKNPLADGSTLGVSSGASLGAILAITLGLRIPGVPFSGTMLMAILMAFLSLAAIITITYRLDVTLSTNTIILLGVVFSMFISSISNLIITFAGDRVKTITFWTLGSLSGSSYANALILFLVLLACSAVLLSLTDELNAFSLGEENARSLGVNVPRVKLIVLICVSILTGVCVSISGSIGFVGLVTPHILRLVTGPNHHRLLPASILGGAIFLMLADLLARTLLRPRELPIGVVTSIIGTLIFITIFYRNRKGDLPQ